MGENYVLLIGTSDLKRGKIANPYIRGNFWVGLEAIGTKSEIQEEFNKILSKNFSLIHKEGMPYIDEYGWYNQSGDFVVDKDAETVNIDGVIYSIGSLFTLIKNLTTSPNKEVLEDFQKAVGNCNPYYLPYVKKLIYSTNERN